MKFVDGAQDKTALPTCNYCEGNGDVRHAANIMLRQVMTANICPVCQRAGQTITIPCCIGQGEGRDSQEEIIPLNIPAAENQDMQLSVPSKGNVPPQGGIPGDLIIIIEEKEAELLKREGCNIHHQLHIGFVDAALGGEQEILIIQGKTKIKLEPGT